MKRAGAISAALFLLTVGCSPKEHADIGHKDICVEPTPTPMITLAEAQKRFGESNQDKVDLTNYSNQLESCLEFQAFEARELTEPMEDVAKAIVAQCAANVIMTKSADSKVPGANAADFDASTERSALGYVLRYRECAGRRAP